jgi:protein ImuB
VDRWACVDVPALPLQLLLRRWPDWKPLPAAVVERDDPGGKILWLNEAARRAGVLPGQRYGAALALCRELRADVVGEDAIGAGVRELVARLQQMSPEVEPRPSEPGVLWLGCRGLERLYGTAGRWAREVHEAVRGLDLDATVVVGFTRFGSYVVARHLSERCIVFADPGEELAAARAAPLARIDIEARLREDLHKLGVTTVGGLLDLPMEGLRRRFGETGLAWRRFAEGALRTPLAPEPIVEPLCRSAELDAPEDDVDRLVFAIKRQLDPLLDRLEHEGRGVQSLELGLHLDTGGRRRETLRPARPTLAGARLLDLVRLRLDGRPLDGKVEEVSVEVRAGEARVEQLRLFAENPRRDRRAAERALARLRAELGESAVVRARLSEGHLPEACFVWEPLGRAELPAARVPESPDPTLVRRIRRRPDALPPRPHQLRDDGWLIRGAEHGAVTKMTGPFVLSGGWWVRPIHREYHYARTERGDLLWVFYDRRRRRWFLQGGVE